MTDHYNRRHDQASALEDRLTSLHNDLLISILSFLPIKQRVALSAVCSRLLRLLPSIPRLDAFRLEVVHPSGGVDISQHFTFPRALIRQCHIVFHDFTYLSKRLEQLLVEDLVEVGVQDLILENSSIGWLHFSGQENCGFFGENCGFFGVKSLRSVSLDGILVGCFDGHPHPPIACTLLTSLKIKYCDLRQNDFLQAFLISCPFLETLHFICSSECTGNLSIHSASIKHLILLFGHRTISPINVRCPNLESLTVNVAHELRIEAPKVRNASLLFTIYPATDPGSALMRILESAYGIDGTAWLMLNSNTTPNGLTAEHEIYRIFCPGYKKDAVFLNFDFDLKDQSSTMILTQLLKKCNNNKTRFDIRVDAMHIQSTNEMARDDHLLHGSTSVELIKLRMIMPRKTFEEFLSYQKRD
ncbi:uncharacterized protein LOC122041381 [Zingiber officinale]|uniref:uncharacterized protein LOC122041381 n=1 Tax=Zingiber officinale TaxID=94328 RepID=UPI001C4C6CE0|nr:uncharacterized protein LOC122041381 [Zingiber officinale]